MTKQNETSDLLPTNPDGTRSVDRSWDQSETWRQMEDLYKSGKVKAIGVANWSIDYLEKLRKTWKIVPAVNQVELHPYLPQHELVEYCKKLGILIEAYSPLGSTGSPLMKDKHVLKIAEETGVTPGAVLLSYHVARGSAVLAKSVTPSRIEDNMKIVKLSPAQLSALEEISKSGSTRFVYPEFGLNLGFPDKDHGVVASAA